MEYRQPEIEQYRKIWIDKECYDLLRAQKKKQGKSMTRLVKDLIIKYFKDL